MNIMNSMTPVKNAGSLGRRQKQHHHHHHHHHHHVAVRHANHQTGRERHTVVIANANGNINRNHGNERNRRRDKTKSKAETIGKVSLVRNEKNEYISERSERAATAAIGREALDCKDSPSESASVGLDHDHNNNNKDSHSVPRREAMTRAACLASVAASMTFADTFDIRRQSQVSSTSSASAKLESEDFNLPIGKSWEKVSLPIEDGVILLDVGFLPGEPNHGFLVGTRQTVLETFDGGKTWEPRYIGNEGEDGEESEFNFRYNAISWGGEDGKEGWIVGKPAVMFHTTDAGKTWERVPLSNKLPGIPLGVYAYGDSNGKVEMVTDQGAIYLTTDGAKNWRAQVQETVDATLNRELSSGISGASFYTGTFATITRNDEGKYVAVNARGNFYMTWEPGSDYWAPHNRQTARRLTNMGWDPDNTMWMLTRGGAIYYGTSKGVTEEFDDRRIGSRGFGLLDIGYRTPSDCWASGGSGSLFHSTDGGTTWKREKAADNLGGNLYLIKFVNPDQGFILGSDSILLRYVARDA